MENRLNWLKNILNPFIETIENDCVHEMKNQQGQSYQEWCAEASTSLLVRDYLERFGPRIAFGAIGLVQAFILVYNWIMIKENTVSTVFVASTAIFILSFGHILRDFSHPHAIILFSSRFALFGYTLFSAGILLAWAMPCLLITFWVGSILTMAPS